MKQAIKHTLVFVVILFSSYFSWAVPNQSMKPSDTGTTTTNENSGGFKNPGILPCPDQSRMTVEKDLAKLENHSRDCGPNAGGAILTQPDRPDGEVRDSDVPSQFR
ncbi:MAG: hypothetical protein J7501_05995 [Bdellovibrio sp.]|nr:hypothetical protein [Bdellovibrio sp.]